MAGCVVNGQNITDIRVGSVEVNRVVKDGVTLWERSTIKPWCEGIWRLTVDPNSFDMTYSIVYMEFICTVKGRVRYRLYYEDLLSCWKFMDCLSGTWYQSSEPKTATSLIFNDGAYTLAWRAS